MACISPILLKLALHSRPFTVQDVEHAIRFNPDKIRTELKLIFSERVRLVDSQNTKFQTFPVNVSFKYVLILSGYTRPLPLLLS